MTHVRILFEEMAGGPKDEWSHDLEALGAFDHEPAVNGNERPGPRTLTCPLCERTLPVRNFLHKGWLQPNACGDCRDRWRKEALLYSMISR